MKKFIAMMTILGMALFPSICNADIAFMVNVADKSGYPHQNYSCYKLVGDVEEIDPAVTDEPTCTAQSGIWKSIGQDILLGDGDIIMVRDIPSLQVAKNHLGKKECHNLPPDQGGVFVCVRITDLTVAQAKNYVKSHYPLSFIQKYRSQFKIDLTALPAPVKTQLWADGWRDATWAQICPYIHNKVTGVTGVCP